MNDKTKGAWLIHHTNKLQNVTNQVGYENTFLSGKAGILLSAISSNNDITINNDKLIVLANAANINTVFELPKLLEVLKEQDFIDTTANGVAVLGVTTTSALQHTAKLFEDLSPNTREKASLLLAEKASVSPILITDIAEELSDNFKLSTGEMDQLFYDSEQFGFVDSEIISPNEKLLFNGNLFRRDTTVKVKTVLDSLKTEERRKLTELNEILTKSACVSVAFAETLLGKDLFQKVTAIGLFDINVVSNSTEDAGFLTLPSAFSKYSNSMVDDAFDLAKAFVSSITYGMTKSSHARGQIQMVDKLLNALIRGESVGPVSAIGQDYKMLELKGVVEVKNGEKKGRFGPMLSLKKKEVGELALQAIRQGDVSEHSLVALPTAAVTKFNGPEFNRENVRRQQTKINPLATKDMLSILRTGN